MPRLKAKKRLYETIDIRVLGVDKALYNRLLLDGLENGITQPTIHATIKFALMQRLRHIDPKHEIFRRKDWTSG